MGAGSAFGAVFPMVLLAVGAIAVVWATSEAERRRHERNRLFAASQGWEYVTEDPSVIDQFQGHPFGVGHGRSATDVTRGIVNGRKFLVFGYRYVTGSGKDRTVHNCFVCAVNVGGAIPTIRITPENPATRLYGALGGGDVDVESEEFNRRWHVWSDDSRIAHALLTPRMIERFLKPDLNWQTVNFEPGWLFVCTGLKLDLSITPSVTDVLCDIAELVPAFLEEDHSEG